MTAERIALLEPTLLQYPRHFTVLDLGAGIDPIISQHISKDYDAVVVMVERDQLRITDFGPRTIWLRHAITPIELFRLSTCEHFDVVLAFNFLHHFEGQDWELATEAVLRMGSMVFVQIPDANEASNEALPGRAYVAKLQDLLVNHHRLQQVGSTAQFPAHPPRPIYCFQSPHRVLTRTHIGAHVNSAFTQIDATPQRILAKLRKNFLWHEWIPAMNLWNFCGLGGVLPSKDKVLQMLDEFPLPIEHHGDIVPWNFLIDGAQLALVDGYEGWFFDDQKGKEDTIRVVRGSLCEA